MRSLVLAVTPVLVSASGDAFTAYLREFNKSYSDPEIQQRRVYFEENARRWAELAKEHPGAQFGATKFSDWSDDEFAQLHPRKWTADISARSTESVLNISAAAVAAAPSSIDWRDHGAVSSIRDQRTCGGCWAFSIVANVEGAAVVQGKKPLIELSEQELLDCSSYCGSYRGYFGCNTGCGGGLQGAGYDDLSKGNMKGDGLDTETQYPFAGKNGKCSYHKPGAVTVSKWQWVDSDEAKIATALSTYGPLSVSVNDGGKGGPWMSYKGGVLSGSGCKGDLNHGVTLVGFGTDAGKDYWLVKNSWGEAWGEKGFIRLARGSCTCGVCKSVATALF